MALIGEELLTLLREAENKADNILPTTRYIIYALFKDDDINILVAFLQYTCGRSFQKFS